MRRAAASAVALTLLLAGVAQGAIRPSFNFDTCAWRATHVVIATVGDKIKVVESLRGDLAPGAEHACDELLRAIAK